MDEIDVAGPTVTIFADHGPLVDDIADEIRALGAATHTVSIPSGWLASTSHALLLLDSEAGRSAVDGLCATDRVGTHVVAIVDDDASAGAVALRDDCAERHDVVVLRLDDPDLVARAVAEVMGTARA